ncbi:hypothetical protein KZX46_06410 [Polymorphobacter sp. PAMC 29334]|uniref:hypothetical protein n=1 Tax=Polymorphobacter sp. PAMC 29334 TaxID=2862331 RepID=UPI001C798DDF|nr:hypothetical protein [Polymorphobacter sp. PAMC 29334]QYE35603.1 hypothetical protein KZX46_06410 [Polymorphobacter sp. PAMC 29334]
MTNDGPLRDGLDDDWRDRLIAIGKGVVGAVPVAGGLVAEIVGMVIPGQRADRVAVYLRTLTSRLDDLTADVRTELMENPEKIDLIEEGGFQSARATSRERIDQIVEAVVRGINEDDAEVVRRKRLLHTLGALDEDEVNILNAYGRTYGGADRMAFEKVNRPDPPHMQSPPSAIDRNVLYEIGKTRLFNLGLLKKNFGNVKAGETPEFDTRTGDFKHNLEISHLGRMLLLEIGLETPFDSQRNDNR